MREIINVATCDACGKPAKRRDIHIAITGVAASVVDLCEEHLRVLEPVHALMARGRHPRQLERNAHRQNRKRTTPGPFPCLAGCKAAAPFKTLATLEQHVTTVHSLTMAEYVETHGEPRALTLEEQASLVIEIECELCGQRYSTALGNRWPQQAMIAHMRGRHEITGWRPWGDPSS